MHKCPRCGQPGGVLLFNLVSPCEQCYGSPVGSKRYWITADYPCPCPEGAIAWQGWAADAARIEWIYSTPVPNVILQEQAEHIVVCSDSGSYPLVKATCWNLQAYRGFTARVVLVERTNR
jgi:hypothetical protein